MSDVLVVVDMQKCFLEEGKPLDCGPQARDIIPRVRELLERESQRGSDILFTADTHAPDDLEFKMWPPHCVGGTAEAEIIPELKRWATPGNIVHKRRYSAFFETDLAARLSRLKPDLIKVCGICTDICVMHSVTDMRNLDYPVAVYEDAVATFDQEAHRFALRHMKEVLGVELRSVADEAAEAESVKTPEAAAS